MANIQIQPSLKLINETLSPAKSYSGRKPNVVPLYATVPGDLLTPSLAYLKISNGATADYSFLFESASTTETVGRYSFVGANPRKVLKTGKGHGPEQDPLPLLEEELAKTCEAVIPGSAIPLMAGGAVGYVGYDCVAYFEPKTRRPLEDVLGVPESVFGLFNTIIAFDHFFQTVKVLSYANLDDTPALAAEEYERVSDHIKTVVDILLQPEIPLPRQPEIKLNQPFTSNIGRDGYESHVNTLKKHIGVGDIIQAVPSQRFARPTTVHPFNIYRHLRTVNPSPYLFYLSCKDFSLVGASPELLVKAEKGRIITHPIAGTVKRGANAEEDNALAEELSNSIKDRAEHVMLVDLARNDVNRVADPLSTRVDRLMTVEKFSHVQHLVSQVSGVLRPGKTRFDAFRSIFPAGTVSGAPKVRAMELIAELEKEKRGIYAGAVGYFGYSGISFSRDDVNGGRVVASEKEGAMDTCIALRTMLVKGGVAYLQAGGGIVFDSDPYDEWLETMNKLGANIACVRGAEARYGGHAQDAAGGDWKTWWQQEIERLANQSSKDTSTRTSDKQGEKS